MTDPTNTLPTPYQTGVLKPCPFCGSSDVYMRALTDFQNYDFRGIYCHGCSTFHVAWVSDENRIESWNRRAEE